MSPPLERETAEPGMRRRNDSHSQAQTRRAVMTLET